MNYINKFETTEDYTQALGGGQLADLEHFIAYTKDTETVYLKGKPDMADIALYDNTTDSIITIHGYNYNATAYPTNRYTPIGIVVVPKSHDDNGKAHIMSLNYMRCDTPKIGGDYQVIYWGLYNQTVEGLELKRYAPYINQSGTTDFGDTQTINGWNNTLSSSSSSNYFPSDSFTALTNPFTKNQGYYNDYTNYYYIPSPYDKNMNKNPIFFTENPTSENPSCLINMDGKGETAKILAQLAINIGNEDWKQSETIINATGSTSAPAAQCCWMYITVGTEQGDWYLPTIGELAYVCARQKAINASITQINSVLGNTDAKTLTTTDYHWSSSCPSSSSALDLSFRSGHFYNARRYSLNYYVRSFALV